MKVFNLFGINLIYSLRFACIKKYKYIIREDKRFTEVYNFVFLKSIQLCLKSIELHQGFNEILFQLYVCLKSIQMHQGFKR